MLERWEAMESSRREDAVRYQDLVERVAALRSQPNSPRGAHAGSEAGSELTLAPGTREVPRVPERPRPLEPATPRSPMHTRTPRMLDDGRWELGSDLCHKMMRNRSLIEKRLSRNSSYEDYQTWVAAVEDWVTSQADMEPEDLASRSVRTVARAATDPALLKELGRRGALADGRTSW